MKDNIIDMREPYLLQNGFQNETNNKLYNEEGICYSINPKLGKGVYWIYNHKDLFSITIHDFVVYEDTFINCTMPEYLSITYYESISGEELKPYNRLKAGCVKGYFSSQKGFNALIHKNIPIKSIGIEITPEYYEHYLKKKYSTDYISPYSAFLSIDGTTEFPEMILLLNQIKNYRGTGMPAKLFYEGKVAESVSIIVERSTTLKPQIPNKISTDDLEHLGTVVAYINDHYASVLHLERLSKIACMGTTKLKSTFKKVYKCTITEYIQQRRMGQAEHLLSNTDLTIHQIAQIVGYNSASRFSELFKKNIGLLPCEYRKLSLGIK
ncbi:helix-turn-helix domain-containing protein [Clostridium sp. LCP25S3_F10]|jgi:AraC-like DNA-binding protein|uniref:helix-turn-helix domain-containing protein n=1 Tax=Clostridium sp. LCP25S3_F10 TaxID=3438750 RepID=UPI003F91E8AA